MSCCGKPRFPAVDSEVWRGSGVRPNPATSRDIDVTYVEFEYLGKTRLSIRGPLTGHLYSFGYPGAVSEVDSRDATYFTGLSKLRMRTVPVRG